MKRMVLSALTVGVVANVVNAGGTIAPSIDNTAIKKEIKDGGFLKTIDGYIRVGYQDDTKDAKDLAAGGKIHMESYDWHGISFGASFYTTQTLGEHDGAGIPFFDADKQGYSILGEAYIHAQWQNTNLKIGRQEIDTPFLDTDDIGMVPNTYEALLVENTDLENTRLIFAHVEKMAGVDAEIDPAKYEKIRDNEYIQILGVEYALSKNITASGWYYKLQNPLTHNLVYADITYTDTYELIDLEIGAQYAHRNLSNTSKDDADIYGMMVGIDITQIGLNISAAYNTARNNYATNGFGGGPFYTSAEHLTLREANEDGDAAHFSVNVDAGILGLEGVALGIGYLMLDSVHDHEATELDLTLSYALNDTLTMDVIYSDVNDEINEDTFSNTRVFLNYLF
jgi:imipenem/basic amino acid-specific outer membrane pore